MSPPTAPSLIYVVGNGPSLKDFDFAELAGQRWIGMNAAYRHWAKTGLYPTHYACLDRVVGLSHAEAIADMVARADTLGIERFLLDDGVADAVQVITASDRIVRASSLGWGEGLTARITTGSHAVLWAAAMGCDAVHLLGVDQNYVERVPGLKPSGDGALEVAEDAQSPNYYFADYQKVGDRLNQPNPVPHVHATAWRRVMTHMRKAHPTLDVFNHSPVSDIPGTLAVQSRDLMTHPGGPEVRVEAVADAAWRDILPAVLPRRFTSLSVEAGLDARDFGAGWRVVDPGNAPHQGRWHLHVQTSEQDAGEPELGSVLFLPPTADASIPSTALQGSEWRPGGLRWFDTAIRVLDPQGLTRGIVGLRVDAPLPMDGPVGKPKPVRRAIASTERLSRRSLRAFRSVLHR